MIQPYEHCPHFDRCSVNACPLDPDIKDKIHVSDIAKDRLPEIRAAIEDQKECKANKTTRAKIAAMFSDVLPNKGLFQLQIIRKQRWEARSPAYKAKRLLALDRARQKRAELASGKEAGK